MYVYVMSSVNKKIKKRNFRAAWSLKLLIKESKKIIITKKKKNRVEGERKRIKLAKCKIMKKC